MQNDPLQLPLPFRHQPHFDARDFVAAESNREALVWLEAAPMAARWPEGRLALFGPAGCGKSHLLHIWAERSGAVLLSGPAVTDLADVPPDGLLAVDDTDAVGDETLLLHLLNTARDRGLRLLLSGRAAPSRWPVGLPDLSSRLRAITAVEIREPEDELLAALLMRLLADRQLAVTEAVQAWLLLRLPRSAAALREAVVRLDRESLASGTAITRALAARVLEDLAVAEPDEVSPTGSVPSSPGHGFL
ncbi:MAG TPA: chromosomal replication initiator DnaA [Rhodopila sp.]|jgi:chromosomal replication initiation ATPase DnaA